MSRFFPIKEISSYCGNSWTIKAKVVSKSGLKKWSNDRGSGHVFNCEIKDKSNTSINCVFYNEAAQQFSEFLKEGAVYLFSGGVVKVSSKRFTTCQHNYELSFDKNAKIELTQNDENIDDSVQYKFVAVKELLTKTVPLTVDLIGICIDSRLLKSKDKVRKVFTLVDHTGHSVDVTCWNEQIFEKFSESLLQEKPLMFVKGVNIREFNGGLSGGLFDSSVVNFVSRKDEEKVKALKNGQEVVQWFNKLENFNFVNLSLAKNNQNSQNGNDIGGGQNLGDMTFESLRRELISKSTFDNEGTFYCTVNNAYLCAFSTANREGVDSPLFYFACPSCNKKLQEDKNCNSCGKFVENPEIKLMIRCLFSDRDGQLWLRGFDETMQFVLGKSGKEVKKLIEEGGLKSFTSFVHENVVLKKQFKLNLKIRPHLMDYNKNVEIKNTLDSRFNCLINSVNKMDWKNDAKRLIEKITEKLTALK